jgi:hypothetical protein
LEKEDFVILYKEALTNSEIHWNCGIDNGTNKKYYGKAVSDLILSKEELVKGLVLFFDSKGFEFTNIKNFDQKLFSEHKIRYFIAFFMCVFNNFQEAFFKFVEKHSKDNFKQLKLTEANKTAMKEKYFPIVLEKLKLINSEFKWYSKLSYLREGGTYTNKGQRGISPAKIDENIYNDTFKRLKYIRDFGLLIIKEFEPKTVQIDKIINYLKKDAKDQKFYNWIELNLDTNERDTFKLLNPIIEVMDTIQLNKLLKE